MTHIENNWEKEIKKYASFIKDNQTGEFYHALSDAGVKHLARKISQSEQRIRKEVVKEIDKKLNALYSDLGWDVDKGDPNYDSYEWGVMRTLAELKCFIFSLTPPKGEDNN